MKDLDVGKYFQRIGSKVTILLLLNILIVGAIIAFAIMRVDAVKVKNNHLKQQLTEKETQELKVIRDARELEDMSLILAEYSEVVGEKDINAYLLNTLKKVEELAIKYSLTNSKHEVDEVKKLKEEKAIPVFVEMEGNYLNVLKFIEELNEADLPISPRDISIFLVEDDYEDKFKDTNNVILNVLVYVFEDITLVEKKSKEEFKSVDELASPYGFYVYTSTEKPTSGIEGYQDFLKNYVESLENQGKEESIDVVNGEESKLTPEVVDISDVFTEEEE